MKSKAVTVVVIALVGVICAIPATSHAWRGGWGWGPSAFFGGALLGAAIAAPYYAYPPPAYAYPPPQVVYTAPPPPPAYAYPAPAAPPPNQTYAYPSPPSAGPQAAPAPQVQGKGQWVEVPGQTVSNMWVPPHKVWVPDNSPSNPVNQPADNQ